MINHLALTAFMSTPMKSGKKANRCGPISTRSSSIAKSPTGTDVDSMSDIEIDIGTVDVAQIDALFMNGIGPATVSPLKTFNTGAKGFKHIRSRRVYEYRTGRGG